MSNRKAEERGKLLVKEEQISPAVAIATGLILLLFLIGILYQVIGYLAIV